MTDDELITSLVVALRPFIRLCHDRAADKGFWDCPHCEFYGHIGVSKVEAPNETLTASDEGPFLVACPACRDTNSYRNDGESIALIHSELSEALEALRDGNPPSEKAAGYSAVEEELADAIIRICDLAGGRGWDVAGAMAAKLDFNETRETRRGREF